MAVQQQILFCLPETAKMGTVEYDVSPERPPAREPFPELNDLPRSR